MLRKTLIERDTISKIYRLKWDPNPEPNEYSTIWPNLPFLEKMIGLRWDYLSVRCIDFMFLSRHMQV